MNKIKTIVTRLELGAAILVSTSAYAAPTPLFTLERSTNANQVVYELRADATIHPYWRMLAQDGHTEELTSFERERAYGVVMLASPDTALVRFSVKALPAYSLSVTTNPPTGQAYATVHLLGNELTLKRIYLHVSGGLIPSVKSIDIEAQNGDSGLLQYFNLAHTGSGFKESQVACVPEWTPGCVSP
jgi:hypothetical protein